MKFYLKLALFIVLAMLYATTGWMAGLGILVVGGILLVRRLLLARRALAPTITCRWCRAQVPQYGPYSCTNCRMRTLGWAWRCPACAAWAGHITCPQCSMSITNPLLPEP